MKKRMIVLKNKVAKFITYFVNFFSGLKRLADSVNTASSPEELDKFVCGGRNEG